MQSKVIVIGLDGGTSSLLKPWLDEGLLPNLADIEARGVAGVLQSTIPYFSGPAWSSFVTGKNPGKHGVYGMILFDPKSLTFRNVNAKAIKSRTLWRLLSKNGRRIGVMNLPFSFPPPEVNGFFISGLGTPGIDSTFTYPPELRDELISDFGNSITVNAGNIFDELGLAKGEEELLSEITKVDKRHGEAAMHLLDQYQPDFFMIVFGGTDVVQHYFWKYLDPCHSQYDNARAAQLLSSILNYYKLVDEYIGKFRQRFGEDANLLVMSDHGFGPFEYYFGVNRWLEQIGLLKSNRSLEEGYGQLRALLASIGLSMQRLRKGFSKINFFNLGERVKRKYSTRAMRFSAIDWERTRAYYPDGALGGAIYVNLKGREPRGIVEPGEEYEELRDVIIARLYEARNPFTGTQIVAKAYKREEIYEGEYVEIAPDIVFVTKDDSYECRTLNTADLIAPLGRKSGAHCRDGIFFATGPMVKANRNFNGANIEDLAPTILYMMGCAIPWDMDGKVLTEVIRESTLSSRPPRYCKPEMGADYEDELWEEDPDAYEKVIEQLRGLGYLD